MTTSSMTSNRLDMRRILPIFVIVLIDLLGLTIIVPLLPLYATTFGADPLTIGMLGATYPVMQFIGAPLLGRLSDRFGRRPVLIVSQIGTLAGFLLLGLSQNIAMLFVSRMIDGLSGANLSTAQAVIADQTNDRTRTQGLGLLGAAFGLGFVVGPLVALAALAATGNNYHAPAFAAAGFSLVSILLSAFWLEESLPATRRGQGGQRAAFSVASMWTALRHPAVGVLLGLIFLQQLAFGVVQSLLSLFTLSRLGLTASGNAIIYVYVGILVVGMQGGAIGPLSRRLGDRRLILYGLGVLAAGLILLSFTPRIPLPGYARAAVEAELSGPRRLPGEVTSTTSIQIPLPSDERTGWAGMAWLLVAMVPTAIGGGVLQPGINSLITKRVDPLEIGGMLGISAAFLSAANATAPLLGGFFFQAIGPPAPFLLGGCLAAVLLFAASRWVRPGREDSPSGARAAAAAGA
jgi:DHA1 family tetracycline resistance protein-like MFS transporter